MLSELNDSLDKKYRKYLTILDKIARDVVAVKSSRIAAAIVKNNNIIAFGINQNKTHPMAMRFSKDGLCRHLHAEVDAIKNALRVVDAEGVENSCLYIARAKYTGTRKKGFIWGLCRPCSGCWRAIQAYKISKIVYTLEGDSYSVIS